MEPAVVRRIQVHIEGFSLGCLWDPSVSPPQPAAGPLRVEVGEVAGEEEVGEEVEEDQVKE